MCVGSEPRLYRQVTSSLRTHFEERAARLSDCATVQSSEASGATTLRLTPNRADAVGVVLYLGPGGHGTVRLDDPAAVPVELGEDAELDVKAIDHVIDIAVDGRATAFQIGRGGCVEEWLRLPPVPLRERHPPQPPHQRPCTCSRIFRS